MHTRPSWKARRRLMEGSPLHRSTHRYAHIDVGARSCRVADALILSTHLMPLRAEGEGEECGMRHAGGAQEGSP